MSVREDNVGEAEAVLAILNAIAQEGEAKEHLWQSLWSSTGYQRLKAREAHMKRDFTDEEFRAFVLSPEVQSQRENLAQTLTSWKNASLHTAEQKALAYLPQGTTIKATIFPVIKPKKNSFVFELSTNPAIFLYLNPNVTEAQFENTMAHELHHVGSVAACDEPTDPEDPRKMATEWVLSFGEGSAMLAAAGGPDIHPHASSQPEDRQRWDGDVANFDADLGKVEEFLLDIVEGRLIGEESIRARGMEFFGIQGPWYTVGWRMMEVIERVFGRQRLVAELCDAVGLLRTFNEAAQTLERSTQEKYRQWSPSLLEQLSVSARPDRP